MIQTHLQKNPKTVGFFNKKLHDFLSRLSPAVLKIISMTNTIVSMMNMKEHRAEVRILAVHIQVCSDYTKKVISISIR